MTKLTPVQAVAWIVGSVLLIPGLSYKAATLLGHSTQAVDYVCRVVQTGPQREALKTSYLAEIIQLSADKPMLSSQFDPRVAQEKLRASPVIQEALVKLMGRDTVYIDYTVRQPMAWLYDFENVALDEAGVPFPIIPFFSPKKLPQVVLGVKSFAWAVPLPQEKVRLALTLLKMMLEKSLNVQQLDVTAAFAPSLGQREIVVILEENGFSKFLRLTPKNCGQEIGNYLELRSKLPPETQVIDLRIPQLAFIESLLKKV